jgi:hypothetical protein
MKISQWEEILNFSALITEYPAVCLFQCSLQSQSQGIFYAYLLVLTRHMSTIGNRVMKYIYFGGLTYNPGRHTKQLQSFLKRGQDIATESCIVVPLKFLVSFHNMYIYYRYLFLSKNFPFYIFMKTHFK